MVGPESALGKLGRHCRPHHTHRFADRGHRVPLRDSRQAARYADAAATIGRYEEVATALFERQAWWSRSGNLDAELSRALSALDLAKVRKLAQDPRTDAAVQRDVDAGTKAGISQTPTLIITHRLRAYPVTGAVAYSMLSRLLDGLLSQ